MAKKVETRVIRTKVKRRTKPAGHRHAKKIGRRSTIFRKRGRF